jgi:hypothetical protein
MGGQGGGPRKGDAVEGVEQGESGKVFFEYVRAADFLWSALRTKSRFGLAGWKEKALRLRRHRLAEQEIRGRIDEVGRSADSSSWTFVSQFILLLQHILKDALGHWTNRVIAVKLRELEVVQQKNKAIVL